MGEAKRSKLRELIAERNAREEEFWDHRTACAECIERGAGDCGGAPGCARSDELARAWTLARDAVEAWRLDRAFEREKKTGELMYRGVVL